MSARSNEIEQLKQILDAKFNARLLSYNRTLSREQNIRRSLANLRDSSRLARSRTVVEMQTIGADVSWHSWLDKQARLLNMELAQVLVQKEQELRVLKKEFGKKFAGDEVARKAVAVERRKSQRAQEDILNETVLRSFIAKKSGPAIF